MENRITFKIKTESYLKLLAAKTMKLHGSNKSKITKNRSSQNLPHLETIEKVLVYCNILNKGYQQDSRVL